MRRGETSVVELVVLALASARSDVAAADERPSLGGQEQRMDALEAAVCAAADAQITGEPGGSSFRPLFAIPADPLGAVMCDATPTIPGDAIPLNSNDALACIAAVEAVVGHACSSP